MSPAEMTIINPQTDIYKARDRTSNLLYATDSGIQAK